jgi:hypothetical protein
MHATTGHSVFDLALLNNTYAFDKYRYLNYCNASFPALPRPMDRA